MAVTTFAVFAIFYGLLFGFGRPARPGRPADGVQLSRPSRPPIPPAGIQPTRPPRPEVP